ncbi:MAG: hypothetical protein QM775_07915 [Pirellulales bacterium]
MKLLPFFRHSTLVIAGCIAAAGPVAAQAPASTESAPTAADVAAKAEAEAKARLRLTADYQLASWLIAEQETGVTLAEAALKQLPDGEAKHFAAGSRDKHQAVIKALQPFSDLQSKAEQTTEKLLVEPTAKATGAGPATPQPAATTTVDVAVPNSPVPVQPVPAATAQSATVGGDGRTGTVIIAKMEGAGFDLVSLKRNLTEQEAALGADWLKQAKDDADRARRYLLLEAAADRELLDALVVFRPHASQKLQAAIDDVRPQLETLLADGQKLLK